MPHRIVINGNEAAGGEVTSNKTAGIEAAGDEAAGVEDEDDKPACIESVGDAAVGGEAAGQSYRAADI